VRRESSTPPPLFLLRLAPSLPFLLELRQIEVRIEADREEPLLEADQEEPLLEVQIDRARSPCSASPTPPPCRSHHRWPSPAPAPLSAAAAGGLEAAPPPDLETALGGRRWGRARCARAPRQAPHPRRRLRAPSSSRRIRLPQPCSTSDSRLPLPSRREMRSSWE
jgi:hypothetical protein